MQPPQGHGPQQMPAQHPQGPPHPYPPYGPPQQRFQPPQRKSKLGWILGTVGAVAVLFLVLVFYFVLAAVSSTVNGINGGGNHEEKAQAMIARADKMPESDWEPVSRVDPKVEGFCLSIDIECVRLRAVWSVPYEPSLGSVAARLGLDADEAASGAYPGCLKNQEKDGSSTASVCVHPAPNREDAWFVSIDLRAK